MLSNAISYDDFQHAVCNLEHLVLLLDGAMILMVEHDGRSGSTMVNLLAEPQAAVGSEVDVYVAHHHDDLCTHYLRCPRCQGIFNKSMALRTCPSCRPRVELERQTADWLPGQIREQASFTLSTSRTALRANLLRRVAERLSPEQPPQDTTITLSDVFDNARQIVEHQVDEFVFHTGHMGDILRLDDRRNLLPSGADLQERHRDYLRTRDKLSLCYTRLRSQVREHPDFREADEAPTAPRVFHSPVTLQSVEWTNAAVPPNPSDDQLNSASKPAVNMQVEQSVNQSDGGQKQPDPESRLDEVTNWLKCQPGKKAGTVSKPANDMLEAINNRSSKVKCQSDAGGRRATRLKLEKHFPETKDCFVPTGKELVFIWDKFKTNVRTHSSDGNHA